MNKQPDTLSATDAIAAAEAHLAVEYAEYVHQTMMTLVMARPRRYYERSQRHYVREAIIAASAMLCLWMCADLIVGLLWR